MNGHDVIIKRMYSLPDVYGLMRRMMDIGADVWVPDRAQPGMGTVHFFPMHTIQEVIDRGEHVRNTA